MAGRFYLSPVIGTGTDADPYRAKVADLALSVRVPHVAHIPVNAAGAPRFSWCIVRAAVNATISGDSQVTLLPALATLWSALTGAQQTSITNAAANRFGLTIAPAPSDTILDVVRSIGQGIDPQFQATAMVDA